MRKKKLPTKPPRVSREELATMIRGGKVTPEETVQALKELWARPFDEEEARAWDQIREWMDEGRPPELRHFRDDR